MPGHPDPATFSGSRCSGRDLPAGLQSPEMIDPEAVTDPEQVLHPVHPPREILPFDLLPLVHRVSPPLPGPAEVVGRHPGNRTGSSVTIEPEQVPVGPDISALVCRVEGEVPDDP